MYTTNCRGKGLHVRYEAQESFEELTFALKAVVVRDLLGGSAGEAFPAASATASSAAFLGRVVQATPVDAHHVIQVQLVGGPAAVARGRAGQSQVGQYAALDEFDGAGAVRVVAAAAHDGPGPAPGGKKHRRHQQRPRHRQDGTQHGRDQAELRASGRLRMPAFLPRAYCPRFR